MKMRPRPKEAERENAQDDPQGIPLGDQLGGVNLGQENLAVPRFPLSSQPRGSRTVEASGFPNMLGTTVPSQAVAGLLAIPPVVYLWYQWRQSKRAST